MWTLPNDTDFSNTIVGYNLQERTSNSFKSLDNLMQSSKWQVEKGTRMSNIVDITMGRGYNIPLPERTKFFEYLNGCRREKAVIRWNEKQEYESGIMIDFDRLQSTNERIFTEDRIKNLIYAIAHIFNDTLQTNGSMKFHSFIISKPEVVDVSSKYPDLAAKKNIRIYKDGIHILIPDVWVTKGYKKFFLDQILQHKLLQNIFSNNNNPITNTISEHPIESMLDFNCKHVNVFFVGCCSKYDMEVPYALTHGFEITTAVQSFYGSQLQCAISPIDLVDLDKNFNICYELSLSTYLPTFYNHPPKLTKQRYDHKPHLDIIDHEQNREDENKENNADANPSLDISALNNPEINYLRQLLNLLPPKYYEEYELWRNVVWAIANSGGNSDFKQLAMWFSRKSAKFEMDSFEKIWDAAGNGRAGFTKGSLIYWAKQSNLEKFQALQRLSYLNILSRAASEDNGEISHTTLAEILFIMFGDKFVVDCVKNGRTKLYTWYEFVTTDDVHGEIYKWRDEGNEPESLYRCISKMMPEVYSQVVQILKKIKEDNAKDKDQLKEYGRLITNFMNSKKALKNDTFQKHVVSQCTKVGFRQRNFIDSLNKHEDIIGVGNGVLLLHPPECQCVKKVEKKREERAERIYVNPRLLRSFHEYKISKYTTVDYYPFDPENPNSWQSLVLKSWNDVFIEDDVFYKMLLALSTAVDMRQGECLLFLIMGGGSNGKTSVFEQVLATIGSYGWKSNIALLTGEMNKAGEANAAHSAHDGKSILLYDETKAGAVLNMTKVKDMTAPTQNTRGLYENQKNFENTAMHFVLSNYEFIVDCSDHGTWRRLQYYKCKTKFRSDPDPKNKHEKLADTRFIREYLKCKEYKEAVLSILVYYNNILYHKYGYDLNNVPCKTIDEETEAFRNCNDMVNRFITQMCLHTPDNISYEMTEVANLYLNWFHTHVQRIGSKPPFSTVIELFENSRLSNYIYKIDNDGHPLSTPELRGIRIKINANDPPADNEYKFGQKKRTPPAPTPNPTPNLLIFPPTTEQPQPPPANILQDNIFIDHNYSDELDRLV